MFPPPAIRNCREDSDTKPCDKRTLVSRKKADSLTAMYIVYRKVKTFPRDFSQAPAVSAAETAEPALPAFLSAYDTVFIIITAVANIPPAFVP